MSPADHENAEPIYRALTQMFVGLQIWLATDLGIRERAQMHR